MAQRYVRVHSQDGKIYYGLLQLSQNVEVLDAPPWLDGQPTDLIPLRAFKNCWCR
jgi:hypothetical protein